MQVGVGIGLAEDASDEQSERREKEVEMPRAASNEVARDLGACAERAQVSADWTSPRKTTASGAMRAPAGRACEVEAAQTGTSCRGRSAETRRTGCAEEDENKTLQQVWGEHLYLVARTSTHVHTVADV